MGLVFGKRSEKNGKLSSPTSFRLGRATRLCSGKTCGVGRRPYVPLFLLCLIWLSTKRLW